MALICKEIQSFITRNALHVGLPVTIETSGMAIVAFSVVFVSKFTRWALLNTCCIQKERIRLACYAVVCIWPIAR
jgi:hypothetical protein